MGNGDAFTYTGTAQLFAGDEIVVDVIGSGVFDMIGEEIADVFNEAFFTGAVRTQLGALQRQYIGNCLSHCGLVIVSTAMIAHFFFVLDQLTIQLVR